MRKRTQKLLNLASLSLVLSLVMLTASSFQIQAIGALDLALGPQVTYLHLKPGQETSHTLTLENRSAQAIRVTGELVDFIPQASTGAPVLSSTLSFPYITFGEATTTEFELKPQQKTRILLRLAIPPDAVEGEHHVTALFHAQPLTEDGVSGSGSQVSSVIGSNLIVLVSAKETDRGKLKVLEIEKRGLMDSFDTLSFRAFAHNAGANATVASGSATVQNWRGDTIAEFDIYPDMVLSQSDRELRAAFPSTTPPEPNIPHPGIEPGDFSHKSPFLLGPYRITVTLHSNQTDGAPLERLSTTIFALPFLLIGLVILGGGLYGLYLYWNKHQQVY